MKLNTCNPCSRFYDNNAKEVGQMIILEVILGILLLAVVYVVATSFPELKRYMRMRRM